MQGTMKHFTTPKAVYQQIEDHSSNCVWRVWEPNTQVSRGWSTIHKTFLSETGVAWESFWQDGGFLDHCIGQYFEYVGFSCIEQLNRWPCHSVTALSHGTFTFDTQRGTPETFDLWDIWSKRSGETTWDNFTIFDHLFGQFRFFLLQFDIFIGPRYTWGPIYGSESL